MSNRSPSPRLYLHRGSALPSSDACTDVTAYARWGAGTLGVQIRHLNALLSIEHSEAIAVYGVDSERKIFLVMSERFPSLRSYLRPGSALPSSDTCTDAITYTRCGCTRNIGQNSLTGCTFKPFSLSSMKI